MKKNHDRSVVVLDREVYDTLVGLAGVGMIECGDREEYYAALRHARKFNTQLAEEHQQAIAREKAAYAAMCVRAKQIVRARPEYVWVALNKAFTKHRFLGAGARRCDILIEDAHAQKKLSRPADEDVHLALPHANFAPIAHRDLRGNYLFDVWVPLEQTADYDEDVRASERALGLG